MKNIISLAFVLWLLPVCVVTAEDFRDPTLSPIIKAVTINKEIKKERSGPQLQAVKISNNSRSAIINNQNVNMGDLIGGAKLISINESEVVLRTGNRLQTLKLFPSSLKNVAESGEQAAR